MVVGRSVGHRCGRDSRLGTRFAAQTVSHLVAFILLPFATDSPARRQEATAEERYMSRVERSLGASRICNFFMACGALCYADSEVEVAKSDPKPQLPPRITKKQTDRTHTQSRQRYNNIITSSLSCICRLPSCGYCFAVWSVGTPFRPKLFNTVPAVHVLPVLWNRIVSRFSHNSVRTIDKTN